MASISDLRCDADKNGREESKTCDVVNRFYVRELRRWIWIKVMFDSSREVFWCNNWVSSPVLGTSLSQESHSYSCCLDGLI